MVKGVLNEIQTRNICIKRYNNNRTARHGETVCWDGNKTGRYGAAAIYNNTKSDGEQNISTMCAYYWLICMRCVFVYGKLQCRTQSIWNSVTVLRQNHTFCRSI